MRSTNQAELNAVLDRLVDTNQSVANNLRAGDVEDDLFNCWGFTSYLKGFEDTLEWLSEDDMNYSLLEDTCPVTGDPLPGDIVVWRHTWWDELLHTAIVYQPGTTAEDTLIIQKPGPSPLELISFEDQQNFHPRYGRNIEYRRIKQCMC